MAFPRRLLNEGEDLVLDLKPHWIFLVPSISALVAAVIVGIAYLIAVGTHGLPRQIGAALLGVVVLVALAYFLGRLAVWATTNFVVTNRRIITGHGVFSKSRKEIPLDRVNDVSFHQGFLERLVGAGDLTIESAGERGQETFSNVNHPDRVQQMIYTQMEAREERRFAQQAPLAPPPPAAPHAPPPAMPPTAVAPPLGDDATVTQVADAGSGPAGSGAGPVPPAASSSIATQIEELHGLLQRGLISQAEFDAKKAQLLDRM